MNLNFRIIFEISRTEDIILQRPEHARFVQRQIMLSLLLTVLMAIVWLVSGQYSRTTLTLDPVPQNALVTPKNTPRPSPGLNCAWLAPGALMSRITPVVAA